MPSFSVQAKCYFLENKLYEKFPGVSKRTPTQIENLNEIFKSNGETYQLNLRPESETKYITVAKIVAEFVIGLTIAPFGVLYNTTSAILHFPLLALKNIHLINYESSFRSILKDLSFDLAHTIFSVLPFLTAVGVYKPLLLGLSCLFIAIQKIRVQTEKFYEQEPYYLIENSKYFKNLTEETKQVYKVNSFLQHAFNLTLKPERNQINDSDKFIYELVNDELSLLNAYNKLAANRNPIIPKLRNLGRAGSLFADSFNFNQNLLEAIKSSQTPNEEVKKNFKNYIKNRQISELSYFFYQLTNNEIFKN